MMCHRLCLELNQLRMLRRRILDCPPCLVWAIYRGLFVCESREVGIAALTSERIRARNEWWQNRIAPDYGQELAYIRGRRRPLFDGIQDTVVHSLDVVTVDLAVAPLLVLIDVDHPERQLQEPLDS